MTRYNVCMFAYNEEKNITDSVSSVLSNTDDFLNSFYVIANGCKDQTVSILNKLAAEPGNGKLRVIDLEIGDKCNAWNHYMHELADDSDVHFFVDADVQFTKNAFPKMAETLMSAPEANAVAGLPFSGRNRDYYLSLVFDRSCLFGNCYGLKNDFIHLIRKTGFRLPIGLSWIDSAITKAVNTDIGDQFQGKPNRVTYNLECGYYFKSLSFFHLSDIRLYISRIARYQVGLLQEKFLEKIEFLDWPYSLDEINTQIKADLTSGRSRVSFFLKPFVMKKLKNY